MNRNREVGGTEHTNEEEKGMAGDERGGQAPDHMDRVRFYSLLNMKWKGLSRGVTGSDLHFPVSLWQLCGTWIAGR